MTTKELIREIPLSSIISKYMTLTSRGKSFEGICPFHQDTKPSLKVSDERGYYKCFACGAGGDVFHFVMNYKNISFPEAIREIAEDHHIPIEDYKTTTSDRMSVALSLLSYAQRVYIEAAKNKNEYSHYLKSRNISYEIAQHLQIGFAPNEDIIFNLIKDDPFKIDLAFELGLIRSAHQGYVDSFKNRIMFPIQSEQGGCVGFCSRSIDEQMPKYLNSKESFIFKKSELLYGLNFSKKEIQKQSSVLVVEGFMDFITLYGNGIQNVVACMGTALSEACILRLNELSSEIILGLDSDEAGKRAIDRINKLMLKNGIIPYSISYSPYKDADEFIQKTENGTLKLRDVLDSSMTILDNEIKTIIDKYKEVGIEKRLRALKEIYTLLYPLGLGMPSSARVFHAARDLNLLSDEKTILHDFERYIDQVNAEEK